MKKFIAIVVLSLALVSFTFIGSHDAEAGTFNGITLNGIRLNALSLNGAFNGISLNALSLNGAFNGEKLNSVGFNDKNTNAKQLNVLTAKDFGSNGLCLNGIILAEE